MFHCSRADQNSLRARPKRSETEVLQDRYAAMKEVQTVGKKPTYRQCLLHCVLVGEVEDGMPITDSCLGLTGSH